MGFYAKFFVLALALVASQDCVDACGGCGPCKYPSVLFLFVLFFLFLLLLIANLPDRRIRMINKLGMVMDQQRC